MKEEPTPERINEEKLSLQLYVSGMSPKSLEAIRNIENLLGKYPKDSFELEIIDIYKNPEVASEQSVVFCPSLVKLSPAPKKILIGTLCDSKMVINALGLTEPE